MAIEFYNVQARKKVSVPEKDCKKVTYHPKQSGGSPRYAVRAQHEGAKLTKFINKDTFDSLDIPEESA